MKKTILAIFVVASFVLMTGLVFAVNGAGTVNTVGQSTGMDSPSAGNHAAIAGNVTELDIVSDAPTQAWSGYFGNVTGSIQLANAGGDVMYNWSASDPSGYVLASVNQTVEWTQLACATADNMTALEAEFKIGEDDKDGVTETFTNTAGNHVIAQQNVNSCNSINVYNDTGASGSNFEELLLWDGDAAVFASILEQDALGFDNKQHDFEMLVLEDGHNNADTKEYYFFVELN